MLKCVECGNLFENGEQAEWVEEHGEKMSGCPLCQGSYEEIEPCKICGGYGHEFGEEYCDDCKENIKKRFLDLIDNHFTEEEKELIKELYEGDWE